MQVIESDAPKHIFHVSSRETIMGLRDEIMRMHGFSVESTVYSRQAVNQIAWEDYDLVLIDVEAEMRVESAQDLCDAIKKVKPDQHVAFVCNHRIAIESDCPDEIIRSEFNPESFISGVKHALQKNEDADKSKGVTG